jgi:hypothetical protein
MRRAMMAATLCCTMFGCAVDGERDEAVQSSEQAVVNPFLVTVTHAQITSAVDSAVDEHVVKGKMKWNPDVDERTEVRRVDTDTYHVDLDLKYDRRIIDPTVDVDFDLGLYCDWRDPKIQVSLSEPSVDVDYPRWVDAATLGVTLIMDHIGDAFAAQKLDQAINSGITDDLSVPVGRFCPEISVNSRGDLELDFSPGDECVNGRTRTDACSGARPLGTGVHRLCVNGRWVIDRSDCGVCNPGATRTEACRPGTHGTQIFTCTPQRTWKRKPSSICERDTPPGQNPL